MREVIGRVTRLVQHLRMLLKIQVSPPRIGTGI